MAAIERAADERTGPRDTLRSASDGGDAPFKPRLGPADGSPFRRAEAAPDAMIAAI